MVNYCLNQIKLLYTCDTKSFVYMWKNKQKQVDEAYIIHTRYCAVKITMFDNLNTIRCIDTL